MTPMGDLEVPVEVSLAKAIKAMIGNNTCLGGGKCVQYAGGRYIH